MAVFVGGVSVAQGLALSAGTTVPLRNTASVGSEPGVLVNGMKVGANAPPEVATVFVPSQWLRHATRCRNRNRKSTEGCSETRHDERQWSVYAFPQ